MVSKEYKLEEVIVRGPVDEHGSLIGIDRLKEESLDDFTLRVMDVYANRANSTYKGLINGITRELGLEVKEVVEIELKPVLYGNKTQPGIILASTYFIDNRNFTGSYDAGGVTIFNNVLTDLSKSWEENTLIGLSIFVTTLTSVDSFKIIANTATTVTIKNNFPFYPIDVDNPSYPYSIRLNLSPDVYAGLVFKVGDVYANIIGNTANRISFTKNIFLEDMYQVISGSPLIDVRGDEVVLYKTYYSEENKAIDLSIPTRSEYPYVSDLVNIINSESQFFTALLIDDSLSKEKLMSLIMDRSRQIAVGEEVPAMKNFKLINKNIIPGTVVFSEIYTFVNEVAKENVSISPGNYYIDYQNGAVLVNGSPSARGIINYYYNKLPFILEVSPVIINSFSNPESQNIFFNSMTKEKYTSAKDKTFYSTPTFEMVEYVSELENVQPLIWRN